MMNSKDELDLFDALSRTRLLTWLDGEFDKVTEVLVASKDIDVLRRSQGRAAFIDSMRSLLIKAPQVNK